MNKISGIVILSISTGLLIAGVLLMDTWTIGAALCGFGYVILKSIYR